MKVPLAVVAEAANISIDNRLNILGIFDSLLAPSVPARHSQMFVVVVVSAEPSERGRSYTMDVVLVEEDGKTVQAFPSMPFAIPPDGATRITSMRMLFQIRDLVFPKFGEYTLDVLIDNHSVAQMPIVLGQLDNPQLPFPHPSDEQG